MDFRPYSEPKWYRKFIVRDIAALVVISGMLYGIAACGADASTDNQQNDTGVSYKVVTVDGKQYNCVTYRGYGIDCDFSREAKP
jgi:hypothetical protein